MQILLINEYYIPAVIKFIEHVRPKYACYACERMYATPKPEQPLAKCLASTCLLTEAIKKIRPLYLHLSPVKDFLTDISDNTLGNWIMQD